MTAYIVHRLHKRFFNPWSLKKRVTFASLECELQSRECAEAVIVFEAIGSGDGVFFASGVEVEKAAEEGSAIDLKFDDDADGMVLFTCGLTST